MLFIPILGFSQDTYLGLVDQAKGITGQVIMAKENGDTVHVYPPKFDWNTPITHLDYNAPPTNSILYFWEKYLADCNKLVADTVKEVGIIHTKGIPVKVNGQIIAYKRVPKDTVWSKQSCAEYKLMSNSWGSSGPFFTVDSSGNTWGYSGTLTYQRDANKDEPKIIYRDKICLIKNRKANWNDFWERWLVEEGIIETN